MTTQVTVNGEMRDFDGPLSVGDIVHQTLQAVDGRRGIAVAVNNDVVPRGSWATTAVAAGDQIEILTATQGG